LSRGIDTFRKIGHNLFTLVVYEFIGSIFDNVTFEVTLKDLTGFIAVWRPFSRR
jgi:hypothetical protein